MLKIFRHKNVARMVLWGLLILILPAFVLWGTGSLGGSKNKGPKFVGIINNKKVSFDDFAKNVEAIRCQIMLNLFNQPKVLDYLLKNKAFVGKMAWDRLIMSEEARGRHIKVSDAEVIKYITSHPIFLRNGQFDDRIYQYFLKNNLGLYPRNFEEIMRESIAIQKLNDLLTKDVAVSDDEVLAGYKKENEKFDEEKYKKDRDEYSKKMLDKKRDQFMEDWLRGREMANQLNIDLSDYEKYYR